MSEKHTPGPWEIKKPIIRMMRHSVTTKGQNGDLSIAHIDDVDGFLGSTGANACLIAAAPELLEACRTALDWLGECHKGTAQAEIAEELRAAIAKAEGQT